MLNSCANIYLAGIRVYVLCTVNMYKGAKYCMTINGFLSVRFGGPEKDRLCSGFGST